MMSLSEVIEDMERAAAAFLETDDPWKEEQYRKWLRALRELRVEATEDDCRHARAVLQPLTERQRHAVYAVVLAATKDCPSLERQPNE